MASNRGAVWVFSLKTMYRKFFFLEGPHFEQDNIPHDRIKNLGIVKCLIRILDRLGIDSRTIVGVILDFDGQITAYRLDEDSILDRNMRMRPRDAGRDECEPIRIRVVAGICTS